uniref:Uncharacterized protein n=1 Tax=Tetranychus urticae TaxID=32264 RepID=T1KPF4_TETUR
MSIALQLQHGISFFNHFYRRIVHHPNLTHPLITF